jgi:ribonuclease P protein subunit RPR2
MIASKMDESVLLDPPSIPPNPNSFTFANMAKAKAENSARRVQNRHVYARMAFLHQAAQHLASKQLLSSPPLEATPGDVAAIVTENFRPVDQNRGEQMQIIDAAPLRAEENLVTTEASNSSTSLYAMDGFGTSRRLASHILSVSRKVSVRASREVKRSICKRCASVLIPGQTTSNRVENQSRGGHKPCADVMVVTCSACGFEKRYPFGAQRQPRKKDRVAVSKNAAEDDTRDPVHGNG